MWRNKEKQSEPPTLLFYWQYVSLPKQEQPVRFINQEKPNYTLLDDLRDLIQIKDFIKAKLMRRVPQVAKRISTHYLECNRKAER